MPVTLQLAGLKYKNSQGQFQSADCLKGEDTDVTVVAPDYNDLTFPVTTGTLCTHSEKLYSANQGIQSSETWTAAHWDETTVDEVISAIKSDVSGKADKVSSATNGNFAGLDSNGNLTDSGKKPSDFLTEHQDISGKLDKTDFYATEMPMSLLDSTKVGTEISSLKNAISELYPDATSADVGKAIIVKTVVDGKPETFELGAAGGGGSDLGLSVVNGELCVTYEEASA